MSDDNVFQIKGGKGSTPDESHPLKIVHKKGIARNHAKLLAKIKLCEDNGRNPAEVMPIGVGCKCGEQFGFPDFMALPIFNMQCPSCRTILLEWVEKPEEK